MNSYNCIQASRLTQGLIHSINAQYIRSFMLVQQAKSRFRP
jgi:hypothetical protein